MAMSEYVFGEKNKISIRFHFEYETAQQTRSPLVYKKSIELDIYSGRSQNGGRKLNLHHLLKKLV